MIPSEVATLRVALGLTQAQFAAVLGVHSITVSKWERGLLAPSPYQAALMTSFAQSQQQAPELGMMVGGLLVAAGVGAALFALLKPAFETTAPPTRKRRRSPARKNRK